MNRRFFICIILFIFTCPIRLFAQIESGAHIIKVVDLPNTLEYTDSAGYEHYQQFGSAYYLDLGVSFKQFRFFFLPLWNYGEPQYVLYREKPVGDYSEFDYYSYKLDNEDVALFHDLYGIPMTPEIPFWDKWGGKLVFLLLIVLFFVWFSKR